METQSPPFKEPVRGNAEGEPREGGLCLSPCCRSPDVAWTSCFHQHPGDSRAGPICTGFLRLHWPERSRLSQGTVQGSLGKEGDIQAWLRVSGKIRAVWSPVQQVGATRSVQGNHQKSAAKTWLLYDAGMPVRFQRPHRAAQLTKLGLFLQNRKGIPWRGRRGRHSPGHWHSSPDRWTSFVGPSLDRSVLLPWGSTCQGALPTMGLCLPWGSPCHGALPVMGLCLPALWVHQGAHFGPKWARLEAGPCGGLAACSKDIFISSCIEGQPDGHREGYKPLRRGPCII